MTERDEYDEIAIRTEAETTPSAALSASDQQADRRLLARSIGFALHQHAATKRCVNCAHWSELNPAYQGQGVCRQPMLIQMQDANSIVTQPDFGCRLFAPRTPERS